tara:strand:- start:3290 stop:4036 length:747 start_codon:yes stop_codon:yes gene_type:complete
MSENDGYNTGDTYELRIGRILEQRGVLPENFQRAGAAGNRPDLAFVYNGNTYGLEVKKDQTADFGQKYLKWNEDNEIFEWSVDDDVTQLYTRVGVLEFINTVENARRFHLNKITKENEEITRLDNKEDQNFFDMNFKIPQDDDLLAEFYNNKGVYYIQIGTHSVLATGARRPRKQPCGFYHLGSDPAKLGTRRFDGYMLIRFRAKQIRSEPVYNYGLQATLKYQPTISSSTFSNFNLEENENQTFPPI